MGRKDLKNMLADWPGYRVAELFGWMVSMMDYLPVCFKFHHYSGGCTWNWFSKILKRCRNLFVSFYVDAIF